MAQKLILPAAALTLMLSAFLLFAVQPMCAKMILPLLGGSPSVWNIAMVFFQALLLAGYSYAHLTSRYLSLRVQAFLHLALLTGFMSFLPFALPHGAAPTGNPALWQIMLMAGIVGAPFFILSASAPIIQHWFAASNHKDRQNPYFLYAASNIGSMAALLSYPILVEPNLGLPAQSHIWASGYGILAGLIAFCGLLVWNGKNTNAESAAPRQAISTRTRLAWIMLAFIPSSLLLGVTTHITTDLASAPLLWVLPLSLYLLTFILVFARHETLSLTHAASVYTGLIILIIFLMISRIEINFIGLAILHLVTFFYAALLCHKKLADMRPSAGNLTEFYMYMSLGGVLGGMFNALLAPVLFVLPFEYTLGLCAALFVRGYCLPPATMDFRLPSLRSLMSSINAWSVIITIVTLAAATAWDQKALYYAAGLSAMVALSFLNRSPAALTLFGSTLLLTFAPVMLLKHSHILDLRRNFFSVLQVNDYNGAHNILHGTTLHGSQMNDPAQRLEPMTYYVRQGPLGDVFKVMDGIKGKQNIATIGLGAGAIACYAAPGRSYDFYEIDPDVVAIAENKKFFTFLSDCGSPYQTKLGDGRLVLAQAPDRHYDIVMIDAFSSDNIPVHLVTREAFTLYSEKTKKDGLILINISNRYLNLKPQLAALSEAIGMPAYSRFYDGKDAKNPNGNVATSSIWAVFTDNPAIGKALTQTGHWNRLNPRPGFRLWTDDYANIAGSLWIMDFFHPEAAP